MTHDGQCPEDEFLAFAAEVVRVAYWHGIRRDKIGKYMRHFVQSWPAETRPMDCQIDQWLQDLLASVD